MWFGFILFGLTLSLFIGMLICLNIGYWIGRRRLEKGEPPRGGGGTLEASIFALLGLILAFTFSGAASRFDARRHLIIEEANTIGTTWLRLELLPPEPRLKIQELFRNYLDARLSAYAALPDLKKAMDEIARSEKIQREIWSRTQAACQTGSFMPAAILILPSLNAMIDIASTRTFATQIHQPPIIFFLLYILALLSSLLAGQSMAESNNRKWLSMILFALAVSITVYVICDLEYPRLGLIRVDTADKVLIDLRKDMDAKMK
jgi:hypothetical protein